MIQASLISGGAELHASFFHEHNNKQVAYEKVANAAEAERRMYFHNRNHFAKTLMSWLKQRKYAMILKDNPDSVCATFLLTELTNIQYGTFRTIEKFIKDNYKTFTRCIPGPTSKLLKHYQREIEPLLEFCK